MPKFTPNGVNAYIEDRDASATETPVAITSLSNAKPAIATVAAGDIASFANGNVIRINADQTPSVDDNAFVVANLTGTTFELAGSDLSGLSAPVTTGVTAVVVADSKFLLFCLTELDWEREAADPIDTTTFCGAESIAGVSAPGTITANGFQNFDEAAMWEWIEGTKDGLPRILRVVYPASAGGGEILWTVTPSGFTMGMVVNEAATFEGTAVVNKEPVFLVGPTKLTALGQGLTPPPAPEPEMQEAA